LLGPLRRFTKGHEYTVGQNSTHNDHAEKSEEMNEGKVQRFTVENVSVSVSKMTGGPWVSGQTYFTTMVIGCHLALNHEK
jgi:hypothetical protein